MVKRKSLEIGKLEFSLKELGAIPKEKRVFFVQTLITLSELTVNKKLLIYSNASKSKIKTLKDARFQITLNIAFSLCTKMIEYWKLIDERKYDSHGYRVGEFSNCWFYKNFRGKLSSSEKKYLSQLVDYFSSPNNIKLIRDKMASHYDSKKINSYLENSQLTSFEFYLPCDNGDEYFSNANLVFLTGLISESEKKAQQKSFNFDLLETFFNKFFGEIIQNLNYLDIVIHKVISSLVDEYFPEKTDRMKVFKIPNSKPIEKLHLNLFSR